jgi:hypothetical protein
MIPNNLYLMLLFIKTKFIKILLQNKKVKIKIKKRFKQVTKNNK